MGINSAYGLNIPENLIPMESVTIYLSAVIVLMDQFYEDKKIIIGDSRLHLVPGTEPIKKTGAVYAAINLLPQVYQADIAAKYYFPLITDIVIPDTDNKELFRIPISMSPKPGYPFPYETTLLNGQVKDAQTNLPITSGTVTAQGLNINTQTQIDPFGRFVLFFNSVISQIINNQIEINLTVSSPAYITETQTVELIPEKSVFTQVYLNKNNNNSDEEPDSSEENNNPAEII